MTLVAIGFRYIVTKINLGSGARITAHPHFVALQTIWNLNPSRLNPQLSVWGFSWWSTSAFRLRGLIEGIGERGAS